LLLSLYSINAREGELPLAGDVVPAGRFPGVVHSLSALLP